MVFRNDPCTCGSGKRYKKCCLKKAKAAEKRLENAEKAAKSALKMLEATAKKMAAAGWYLEEDDLDEVSNSVLDLVEEKRFPDALAACERLLREYPDVVDGLERSGMVYEAMGELEKARDFYARALAFTELPEQRDGFGDGGTPAFCRERMAEIDARLAGDPG